MKLFLALVTTAVVGLTIFAFKPSDGMKMEDSFDFGSQKTGTNWRMMNDDVMGGLSSGSATLNENSLEMKGRISLANNGGFSSVRSPWGNTDISSYENVVVRYRSKGQVVAFTLETNRRWWLPYYLIDLPTTDGAWSTATIKLTSAIENAYARPTGNQIKHEQLKSILRFGFMTHEKKESDFEFEVNYVRFE